MQNKLLFISHLFFSFTYFIFVWQHLSELLISTRALTFITKYLLCDRHYGEHFIITLLTPDNNCDGASSHCTDKKNRHSMPAPGCQGSEEQCWAMSACWPCRKQDLM